MNPTVKPGYCTTEFWLTILTGLIPVLTIILKHDVTSEVQAWAVIASGVATSGYIISRVFVKRKALDVTASIVQANASITAAQPAFTGQTVYVQPPTDTVITPVVSAPVNTEPGTASAGFTQG